MTIFQGIFVPVCSLAALLVLSRWVRGQISKRSGLGWFALWVSASISIAFPAVTTLVARRLGIGRGADLVFYLAILGGVAVTLYFYVRCRRLEVMITDVVRREALTHATLGRRRPEGSAAADVVPQAPSR